MKKIFQIVLLFSSTSYSFAQTEAIKSMNVINPDAIKATMTYLSDDLMEGRQPGTKGFALASKYVESRFMALGLKPAIEGKSYIQKVPLRKGIVNENESSLSLVNNGKEENLVYGKHFLLSPNFNNENSEIEAPLVFIGFGVHAPELGYDDYQKVDLKGKIVVMLSASPEKLSSNERAYFSNNTIKFNDAIKRGAIGVITFSMPSDRRTNFDATAKRAKQGSLKWLNANGYAKDGFPELKAIATFNNEYADKLFVNAGKNSQDVFNDAKAGKPQAFPLNISAKIKVKTTYKAIEGSNLVGIIEGSDPKLKNEYVVYTAHLDHLGIGSPVKGDSIYNGAHDDASGVGILLEIASVYRSLPTAPKRSVVIGVVTGEESGLLGSDYFVNNSPIKDGKIVANLAIDMPFFFHPVLDIVPYGFQHSSLSKQVEKATSLLKLKISPDPFPEQVVFVRSDHFSFIKKGIPALFIKSGFMTVPEDKIDRSKSDVAWRTTTYHTPQDDMNQAFDFEAAATHVKINFLIGYFVCNEPIAPTWNKGDFFGGKFGK
jgi:Peptidase family M28/PA domain